MTYLLLFLLPLSVFGGVLDLTEEELNPETEEILIKKPEKYLQNESMIYDLNSNLGIQDQRKYTGTDQNRLSLSGHVSGDYEHFNDLLGLDAIYMRRSERYDQIWWGVQVFRHKTYFDAITRNRSQTGGANTEGSFRRPGDTDNDLFAIGLGAAYRFKLLYNLFSSDDIFESVEVFVNSIQLDESFIKETYRGYGLTTNYSIHKRTDSSYFYGGKFSYNVASVTRSAIGSESKSDRSLSLGWTSLAFEIGFFF